MTEKILDSLKKKGSPGHPGGSCHGILKETTSLGRGLRCIGRCRLLRDRGRGHGTCWSGLCRRSEEIGYSGKESSGLRCLGGRLGNLLLEVGNTSLGGRDGLLKDKNALCKEISGPRISRKP